MKVRIWPICMLVIILAYAVGCNSPLFNQHAQIADSARGAIEEVKSTIGPDGMGQFLANAHVNNPGVRAGGGVEYYGYIRYEGLDANVSAGGQGNMNRELTPDVQRRISEVTQSTTLNAREKREAIMSILSPLVDKVTGTDDPRADEQN